MLYYILANLFIYYYYHVFLLQYTHSQVPVLFVEGNHYTILENKKTADIINKLTNADSSGFKKEILAESCGTVASLHKEIKHLWSKIIYFF